MTSGTPQDVRPALTRIVERWLGEAAHSGAGLSDYPDEKVVVDEIIAALGLTQEDVKQLQEWAYECGPGTNAADWFRSLASRIQALLPPEEK